MIAEIKKFIIDIWMLLTPDFIKSAVVNDWVRECYETPKFGHITAPIIRRNDKFRIKLEKLK